jgi:hypothetical protein
MYSPRIFWMRNEIIGGRRVRSTENVDDNDSRSRLRSSKEVCEPVYSKPPLTRNSHQRGGRRFHQLRHCSTPWVLGSPVVACFVGLSMSGEKVVYFVSRLGIVIEFVMVCICGLFLETAHRQDLLWI